MKETRQTCIVFNSWQSDRKECRNFVSDVLKKLQVKAIPIASVEIDRDTLNVPGSPDIGDTIFEKIEGCDFFVADVTPIVDKNKCKKPIPNPNVLIELGFAIKALGWNHIIMLCCTDYGDVEDLPFDINHRRICKYTLGKNLSEEDRQKAKKESKEAVLTNIIESVQLLIDKGLLYEKKNKRAPKFETKLDLFWGGMSNMKFSLKNVSGKIVSNIIVDSLIIIFDDGEYRDMNNTPTIKSISLNIGESTTIEMNNNILGAGPGYNNAFWSNIDVKWQFRCEDEEYNIYCYEVSRHIESSAGENALTNWEVRYIG